MMIRTFFTAGPLSLALAVGLGYAGDWIGVCVTLWFAYWLVWMCVCALHLEAALEASRSAADAWAGLYGRTQAKLTMLSDRNAINIYPPVMPSPPVELDAAARTRFVLHSKSASDRYKREMQDRIRNRKKS